VADYLNQHLDDEQLTNHDSDSITRARHTEIARRYAWQARQRRKRHEDKPDPARLMTLIRMRELERIFARRYGRLLPDDDAGRDDLIVAAHHIAFLGGDVIEHIVDWARAWAPWMPSAEAERLAERVAAKPRKWTADTLAWRLRLSMAERTELGITTIGAFDVSKAEREVQRKQKRKEAERARRAKRSTGRPRGRPKTKCVASSKEASFAGHAFSADAAGSARELPDKGPDGAASTKTPLNSSPEARRPRGSVEDQTPVPTSACSRAAPPQKEGAHIDALETKPPPGVVAEAIKIARTYAGKWNCSWGLGEQEARRLLDLFWPRHLEQVLRCPDDHSRASTLIHWQFGFRIALDREHEAKQTFRERRRKWERDRERSKQQQQHELAITAAGGRLPPPQKIVPPRKIGPPRSKLAPGYRYVTMESLAKIEAKEAQARKAQQLFAKLYARRRERALRGADVGGVAP
jgi:hypothetical protein